MTDREKVIYDIERCISPVLDACRDCSHFDPTKDGYIHCMEELLGEAVELLKEQEPVEPDGENCGECGYTLHRINYDGPDKELWYEWFLFCPSCGKAVKWDAVD